jgi:Cu/Ag efflux pump CusA
MTRAIVSWSLRFRLIVVGLAIGLLVFGIATLRQMPVDVVPEFAPPYVEVQTEALGLSAEEVEQLITVPLEADLLHGVAWLDQIRSESVSGLSSIVLIFEPGTDVFRARQMVAERLTQAHALPNVSKPPAMLQPLSSTSRVMMIGLTSKDVSSIDMSVLARWTIRPTLMGVPGVANVAIWGQRERQLQVLVDPARLKAQDVSLDQVIETTGNALWFSPLTFLDANTPGTGGFIDTPNQRLGVQHILPIRTAEDLAKVTIVPDGPTGRSLSLGEVATVVQDHQPLIGDAIVGEGEGLLLVVEKFPGASTLEVTEGLEKALAELSPGLQGIDVDSTVFRPATFLESALQNLGLALGLALVLIAVTFLTLGFSVRGAVASLVAIIVSMVAAAAVLYALGATLNALVVAGLVLAGHYDDSVIGIGEIRRRMAAQPADGDTTPVIVQEATVQARSPLAFATVIVVLITVPLFLLPAPVGQFVPTMAAAYLLAIVASLVVAMTLTPALASLLRVGAPSARPESAFERRLRGGYASLLERTAHVGPALRHNPWLSSSSRSSAPRRSRSSAAH